MSSKAARLYYHTGTGNSLKIAKDIGSKLGDHELIPIAKLLNGTAVVEGDIVDLKLFNHADTMKKAEVLEEAMDYYKKVRREEGLEW